MAFALMPMLLPLLNCRKPSTYIGHENRHHELTPVEHRRDFRIEIHLKKLSDGGRHPAARYPTINYSRRGTKVYNIISVPITSSRLVVSANVRFEMYLIIWDWKSAQALFVRQCLLCSLTDEAQTFMQELEVGRCNSVEFIDEYRLLTTFGPPGRQQPSMVVTDTGKTVRGAAMQTFFHLPLHFSGAGRLSFLLERGVHKPSPAETLAPFYQDPSQRIVTLVVSHGVYYPVFQVGALLELLESREGSEIGWDEWKGRVVIPSIGEEHARIWVSGCRLFRVISTDYGRTGQMKVYDFSMRGRATYRSERVDKYLGTVKCLSPAGVSAQVPRDGAYFARASHDSTVFSIVSVGACCSLCARG